MRNQAAVTLFKRGENCWDIARANRAAVLVDGANYFSALRGALRSAQHSIFIVGWDIDSRVTLCGEEDEPDDGLPLQLGPFLTALVEKRPELTIYLLLWDYSVIYALEREPVPSLNLDWKTPRQIKVCLDDILPLGGSHHQKIVVIDDAVAFCGGIDLTIRRWDTSAHEPDDERRRDPGGESYAPFHDLQMCVDGDCAAKLGELVRARWHAAACHAVSAVPPEQRGDPWPDALKPDFSDTKIAIARTIPAIGDEPEVREIEALYIDMIGTAEQFIYIENQFLTSDSIASSLAQRLQQKPELEVLFVSPEDHPGWLEARSMKAGRIRFMQTLEDAGVSEQVRLTYPAVGPQDDETAVMVHAKLMIVDDRCLRLGSSNLNNRSMGMDTECDLAIAAEKEDGEGGDRIAAIRNRLLAEHLGTTESKVADTFAETGSLLATVDTLNSSERRLQQFRDSGKYDGPVVQTVSQLADPERPVEAKFYVGDMFGGQPPKAIFGKLTALFLMGGFLAALALAWRYTPLADFADPEQLKPWLADIAGNEWAMLIVPLLYIAGALVIFPVTVLIAATALLFEPLQAFGIACAGALSAAAVTYAIGALCGKQFLRDLMGQRINRVSRALAKQGVLSVMAIRLVPIAPFSIINLVAGVSHIGFIPYLLGTILGMVPGIIIFTALGNRLRQMIAAPSTEDIVILIGIIIVWIAMSVGLQAVIKSRRG